MSGTNIVESRCWLFSIHLRKMPFLFSKRMFLSRSHPPTSAKHQDHQRCERHSTMLQRWTDNNPSYQNPCQRKSMTDEQLPRSNLPLRDINVIYRYMAVLDELAIVSDQYIDLSAGCQQQQCCFQFSSFQYGVFGNTLLIHTKTYYLP